MGSKNIDIKDYVGKRVHFVGIGGCSMSGLAGLLKQRGYDISGSDSTASHATEQLIAMGIPVSIGHAAEHVADCELLVFTAAIPRTAPERVEARRRGIPELERIVLLGQIMEGHETAVAVCGTHGKTTTTSMLARALMEAGVDPTIHIGGDVDFLGGSTRYGGKKYFVCEACELNAGFLALHPTQAIVLNIEADHLDYYRDINHIAETFKEFIKLLPKDGCCIGFGDDPIVAEILRESGCPTLTFGLNETNDVYPKAVSYDMIGQARFTPVFRGRVLGNVSLSVGGEYNMINALSVIASCVSMNIPMDVVCRSLSEFTNPHRRFELTGRRGGVMYYHDYGHHPTAVRNVLAVAKKQPHKRLFAVQQPHTYSRTKALMQEFSLCFDDADVVLVTDIYAAREIDPGDVHATELVELLLKRGIKTVYTPTFEKAEEYLLKNTSEGDLVITLGCGNINLLNELIGGEN